MSTLNYKNDSFEWNNLADLLTYNKELKGLGERVEPCLLKEYPLSKAR